MKTTLLLTSLFTLALASLALAQQSMLPNCYGMTTDPTTKVEYCISSDGKTLEKQRLVELQSLIPADAKRAVGSSTQKVTLRTGKSKTVGETVALLTSVFQKFLSQPTPGAVLGKLGSLDKGGEVEFVAVSSEVLQLDFKSASGVQSTEYSKSDVTNYLAILKK